MRLLDLFSGAGGCSVGYHRAGFTKIVGVDFNPQPHYPYEFVQGDALKFLRKYGRKFDAIHASPPCQRYSISKRLHDTYGLHHPDLVGPTREILKEIGKPWVIENVVGAPMRGSILLCGTMFGLRVYRHRLFLSNLWDGAGLRRMNYRTPRHGRHVELVVRTIGRRPYDGMPFVSVFGHDFNRHDASDAMKIDWMPKAKELAQAIPPAYTEWVGRHLLSSLRK